MGIKLITHPFNKDCNATQRILNVIATNTTRSPRTEASECAISRHQSCVITMYSILRRSPALAQFQPVVHT